MFLNRNIFHGIHILHSYIRYPLNTALLHSIPSIINEFKIDDEDIRVMQRVSNHDGLPKDIRFLEPKQWMGMPDNSIPKIWPSIEKPIVVNFITLCARPDYEDSARFERGCRYGGTDRCNNHEDVLCAIDESTNEPILYMGAYKKLSGQFYRWVNWYGKTDGPLKGL